MAKKKEEKKPKGRTPMSKKIIQEIEEMKEYPNSGYIPRKQHQKTEHITSIVYTDLMNGAQPSQIITKLMTDEYNLGRKYSWDRANKYLVMARRIMRDDVDKQRPFIKHQLVTAVMDILSQAKMKKDLNIALKAIDQIAKMTGCYDAQKLEIHQDFEINFGFEEDKDIINVEAEEINDVTEEEDYDESDYQTE